MPRLRQLPELFIRGAVANETMKHLTEQQKQEAAEVVEFVANHPRLAANRTEFIKQLGRTIGGDYREDKSTAEQEFTIAIWRGVVHLLFHRSYGFRCDHCEQTSYLTQRNKPSPMDRRYPVCPSCRHVKVTSSGETDLVPGTYLPFDAFQNVVVEVRGVAPQCGSPVSPIPGDKKVENAQETLGDPDQMCKFFSEFIWNYFRQILKENDIVHHQKTPVKETGPADRIAVLEVVSLLGRTKSKYYYCKMSQPEKGAYHIWCETASTPPEFTPEFVEIAARYREQGVNIQCHQDVIIVPEVPTAPLVDAFVVRPAPVLMSPTQSRIGSGEESSSYAIERLEYRASGGNSVESTVEDREVLDLIRSVIPDGECQTTFDLLTGRGEVWHEFSDIYGDNQAQLCNIAEFLNTTTRVISAHKQKIGIVCLAHNFVPGSVRRDDD